MTDLEAVFSELREVMGPYAGGLERKADTPTNFYLEAKGHGGGKPMFFGAVQLKKTHVSYHLMPVYTDPDLLETVSPELKRRMQGKSCFNFRAVDTALFEQLAALTKASLERYRQNGYA